MGWLSPVDTWILQSAPSSTEVGQLAHTSPVFGKLIVLAVPCRRGDPGTFWTDRHGLARYEMCLTPRAHIRGEGVRSEQTTMPRAPVLFSPARRRLRAVWRRVRDYGRVVADQRERQPNVRHTGKAGETFDVKPVSFDACLWWNGRNRTKDGSDSIPD